MRFCQSDGTPLVDDAPPLDPYKTMVARPEDIAASTPKADAPIPPPAGEQVLEIPQADADPNKTMFASEEEIRGAMDARDEQVIEIPPLTGSSEGSAPSYGGTPPSPFDSGRSESPFEQTKPPIPSPFDSPKPSTFEPLDNNPAFAEPEPIHNVPPVNPFDMPNAGRQEMAQQEWTPPPAPDAGWQNQQIGQNTPFQPPPAGSGSVNQTLPIISLVLGIVSLCCYVSPLTGIGAVVTGYLALKNIKTDPANYGGKGLAIAGMAIGGIFLAIGLIYWILIIFFGGLNLLMNAGR
jgi:hypothetical protein